VNYINRCEILYIDSASTDGSIDKVKAAFGDGVTIYRLSGAMNAGIARNEGAKRAVGDALFFVDGDMEIDPGFFNLVYGDEKGLNHDAVSGKLEEFFYDGSGKQTGHSEDRHKVMNPQYSFDLGGVFFIKKDIFEKLRGFKPHLKENEDIDLVLRLFKNGIRFLRLPQRIATHHTIDYHSYHRLFTRFLGGNHLYDGILYRENITNIHCLRLILVHQRFTAILFVSMLLAVFVYPAFAVTYPVAVFLKYLKNKHVGYLETLMATLLRDVSGIAGLFYFPRPILPNATQCKHV
jgi:GT2 family glycosyltransferase